MNQDLLLRRLATAALLLCLVIVVLGAYVRLSDAGLGCPDWPGCYGHLSPVGAAADTHVAATVEVGKAWREMVHRYAVGTLSALILVLFVLALRWRARRAIPIGLAATLVVVLVCQATLGALTVTWKLAPLIVTSHLLLGLTTLALLAWMVFGLRASRGHLGAAGAANDTARTLAALGLVALGVQLALGGWTSSNYAAIACPDVPTCQAHWWPPAAWGEGFTLWRGLGVNYAGGVLDITARTAIHFAHRLGALVVTGVLVAAALSALRARERGVRDAAYTVLGALALQLVIGISMVVRGFPLWLATAHNAGAALLLLAVLGLNHALRERGVRA